jgi:PleD family two-component response regulator
MGVIMINESSCNYTTKEIYKLADDKLYISKQNGRDRYTI